MKVEVKEVNDLTRDITVEIEADKVNGEMDRQIKDVRKKVELKGFRKGKAPLDRVKALYENEVKATVVDELIKSSYPDVLDETALKAAAPPMIVDLKFNDDGSLVYVARVEIMPEIKAVKFDGLELVRTDTEVTDEEVNQVSEYYQEKLAEERKVDRESRENDIVVVDLKKLEDPKNIMKDDQFEGAEIDLGKEVTFKEFKENLIGLKAGDEKDVEIKYPDDYPDERFAGATIKYHCTLKEVKERNLPPFDDALAKRTGQAETALELKLKIREDIKKEKEQQVKSQQKNELIRQFVQKNDIPIPESWLDNYLNKVVEDVKKKFPDEDEKKIREQYRETGLNSMRWSLLMHELSVQEKIEVLPSDTEKWINRFAEENKITPDQAKEALNKSGRARDLKDSILEEKVIDFLLEKANFIEPKTKE